jgi:hypothetical protein
MSHYYLEEDPQENILIHDAQGQEVARFWGEDALNQALLWADERGYPLWANVSPIDLLDNQRLYFRRRPRFLRLQRYRNLPKGRPQDPPNVKRISTSDQEWFEDEALDEDAPITLSPSDTEDWDDEPAL